MTALAQWVNSSGVRHLEQRRASQPPLAQKAFPERINHSFKALFGSEVYSQSQPIQDKVKKEKPHGMGARCSVQRRCRRVPAPSQAPETGGPNAAFLRELEEPDGAGGTREPRDGPGEPHKRPETPPNPRRDGEPGPSQRADQRMQYWEW